MPETMTTEINHLHHEALGNLKCALEYFQKVLRCELEALAHLQEIDAMPTHSILSRSAATVALEVAITGMDGHNALAALSLIDDSDYKDMPPAIQGEMDNVRALAEGVITQIDSLKK